MSFTHIGSASAAPVGNVTALSADISGLTILSGDLIFVSIHMNGTSRTSSMDADAGATWNLIETQDTGMSGGSSYGFHWKVADGSEPSTTYDATLAGTTNRASMIVEQFRPGAGTPALDVSPTTDGTETGSTSIEFPSITVAANSVTIGIGMADTNSATIDDSVDNGFALLSGVQQQVQSTAWKATGAGATGETKMTGANIEHQGWSVSFKEDAGGGAVEEHFLTLLGVGT